MAKKTLQSALFLRSGAYFLGHVERPNHTHTIPRNSQTGMCFESFWTPTKLWKLSQNFFKSRNKKFVFSFEKKYKTLELPPETHKTVLICSEKKLTNSKTNV